MAARWGRLVPLGVNLSDTMSFAVSQTPSDGIKPGNIVEKVGLLNRIVTLFGLS